MTKHAVGDENLSQTEVSATEYKNDEVSLKVESHPGCLVKMEIIVSPKASLAAYKRAMKSINKEVSLPGFRKGKTPDDLLMKHFSNYVDQEWRELLVRTAFNEALLLSKLRPLNDKSVKKPNLKNASKENGAEISIEFESIPSIPEISTEEIVLSAVQKKQVGTKQLEDSLQEVCLHHGEWTDIADRPVQEGDYVDVDIEDQNKPGFYICKNTRFEVAQGKMGDWMRKLIVGKNVGETAVGMSEPGPELDSTVEFRATECKISLKAIKHAEPATLDDALAKKLGAESVEQLKERLLHNLEREAEEGVKQNLRNQLAKILVEKYPFEVPSSLLHADLKTRINHLKNDLTRSGKSPEEIAAILDREKSNIEKTVKESFQLFFIARQIADRNDIHVLQDELLRELMFRLYAPSSDFDPSEGHEEMRSRVYIELLIKKVEDLLIHSIKIQ